MFVAIVASEVVGQQIVPNGARMVKEAKVRMARDGARKASQAKGKLMVAKERAKVASGKHARHLKGIAITVGNWGHMEKDCFTKAKAKGGEGKSAGRLDESEANGPENTSADGFGFVLVWKTKVMTGSGKIIAK